MKTERNHQVTIMSEIYAKAERVIVWLGCSARGPYDDAKPNSGREYRYDDWKTQIDFRNMIEIVNLQFWCRLWIIQEVILGREITVLLGPMASRWAQVREHFYHYYEHRDHLCPAIVTRKVVPSLMTNRFALHRALELFAGHECADPRDKVYGLMGIVDKMERIEVDYGKSAAEVYWDAVAAFKTKALKEPARIIELGRAMGATGREESCKGLALENFQLLFGGAHPMSVLSADQR